MADFSFDEFRSIYESKLSELKDIDFSGWLDVFTKDETEKRLYSICCTLSDNAKKFNLTSILDAEGMTEKHIIDSVLPIVMMDKAIGMTERKRIIDIGAGAGFPSLPMAAVLSGYGSKVFSVDSTAKKIGHITESAENAGLGRYVTAQAGRAEDMAHKGNLREKFDIATARAVASLPVLIELCGAFVVRGGYFVALKSHCDDEIAEAAKAAEIMGFSECQRVDYSLPCGDARSLCIYKKIKNTEIIYPRQYNKISAKHL